jgi:hypothetical protein
MSDRSHLEHLIERQVTLWEMNKRLSAADLASARDEVSRLAEGPWITVSTQLGSQGRELARRLGLRLGWQVFDKEILQAICRETHTKEKILSRLDGHAVSALEDYLAQLLVPDDPGQPAYVIELMRVIWAVARQGQAILVGRGANWLIDPRYGLRVRGIAPFEQRVDHVAHARGVPASEARKLVKEDDSDRARFIRQVYRKDIDDALGYDLVLNLGTVDMETAVEAVMIALPRKLRAAA